MSLCAIKDSKSKSLLTKNFNKMHLSLDMNNSLGWTQQRPETTNIQQVLESSLIVSVADLINLLLIIPTSNTSEVRAELIKRMSDEDTSVSGSFRGHRRVQIRDRVKSQFSFFYIFYFWSIKTEYKS